MRAVKNLDESVEGVVELGRRDGCFCHCDDPAVRARRSEHHSSVRVHFPTMCAVMW